MSPTTSVTLKPSRSVPEGYKRSNSCCVSVAISVLGRLDIRAVTGNKSHCYSTQLIVINGRTPLDVVFTVPPGKDIRRLIYLTVLTLFHDERVHCSPCNAAAVA
jgi:hypothetical protein